MEESRDEKVASVVREHHLMKALDHPNILKCLHLSQTGQFNEETGPFSKEYSLLTLVLRTQCWNMA